MTERWIIGYMGRHTPQVDVTYAETRADALQTARMLTIAAGWDPEDVLDDVWAKPYTPYLAFDLDLLPQPTGREFDWEAWEERKQRPN